MNEIMATAVSDFLSVGRDILPLIAVALFFQFAVIRKPLPRPKSIFLGFIAVIAGLYLFLLGLDMGVFEVGAAMAKELARPETRIWAIAFAFCIGYTTTLAEPALLAVAAKAEEITAGNLPSFPLRNAVAMGVAIGLSLGVYRIFEGHTLWYYILTGYVIAIALTFIAPKEIVPLAYDTGGVTTGTLTVPFVAALGIGLATNVPGRDPLIDGFGLIAFASVFPIISVLGYAIVIRMKNRVKEKKGVS